MKIVLDPGHGGNDPGTVGNGLQEKDINLAVANDLSNLLINAGYDVVMTRYNDEYLSLLRRSQIAAEENADVFISIHVNAGGGQGSEVYYSITDKDPVLAQEIVDNLAALGFRNRGIKTRTGNGGDYYSVIRETVRLSDAKPYLVEMFYIDNATDVETYRKVGNQALANAIFNAIQSVYPATSKMPEGTTNYTVKAGDSLYSISRRFDTTVQALRELNNLTSDSLYIGQQLRIPGYEDVMDNDIYIVQPGDSLYTIARQFNTTIDALMTANMLTSDALSVGQSLTIPNGNIASNDDLPIHVVQAGESLYQIAERYDTTVQAIMSENDLVNDDLYIGQQLRIPQNRNTMINDHEYIVKAGDSLYSIAQRFNTTVEALMQSNQLVSDRLYIGQALQIPTMHHHVPMNVMYTVKAEDTLYSIATNHQTTVDEIKNVNNLTSDLLRIGQRLTIPS